MRAKGRILACVSVAGLLGLAALCFVLGSFESDYVRIAETSNEYLKTPEEFAAEARRYFLFSIMALFVAVSISIGLIFNTPKTNP